MAGWQELGGGRLIFGLLQSAESLVETFVERNEDDATNEVKNHEIRNANHPLPSLREDQHRHYEGESQKENPSDQDECDVRNSQLES